MASSSGGPNWKSTHLMSTPSGLKTSSTVCRAFTAGKKPPFCVPIRISFGAASPLACDDSAAMATVPRDSLRNSRRFIASPDKHAATTSDHAMQKMMVWREKRVERAQKIAMPTLSHGHRTRSLFQRLDPPQRNSSPRRVRFRLAGGRDLRGRDVHRELAVAVGEGLGVDLFELDRPAHDALLPGVVLGIVLELRHHFLAE